MKVLFIGLGSIGQRHLRNLNSLGTFEFFAIRNRNLDLPDDLKELEIKILKNWDEVKSVMPDLCIIASPPIFQQKILNLVVELGLDFFVEKPIGVDINQLNALVKKIEEKKLITMVGYNLRFHPVVVKIDEILKSGQLGNITSFRLEIGQYLPDWHPAEDYRKGYSANSSLGGGVTLDLIHEIDLAFYLFGEFDDVKGMISRNSHLEIDVEDTSEILVRTQKGFIGSIHMDYINRKGRRKGTIVGDLGTLDYDLLDSTIDVNFIPNFNQRYSFEFLRNEMYKSEMKAFVEAVRSRYPLEMNYNEGLKVLSYALQSKV